MNSRGQDGGAEMKWGALLVCAWMLLMAWWLREHPGLCFLAVFVAGMHANEFERSGRSEAESEVTK